MTHRIDYQTDWVLLDDLYTYLWKLFPMDHFEFRPLADLNSAKYSGTATQPPNLVHREEFVETPSNELSFTDEIDRAVRSFLSECVAA